MDDKEKLELALTLLKEAHEVLSAYWFHELEDGDSDNNDDVIAIDMKIQAFLEPNIIAR